jgi:hypothetical protein
LSSSSASDFPTTKAEFFNDVDEEDISTEIEEDADNDDEITPVLINDDDVLFGLVTRLKRSLLTLFHFAIKTNTSSASRTRPASHRKRGLSGSTNQINKQAKRAGEAQTAAKIRQLCPRIPIINHAHAAAKMEPNIQPHATSVM